MGRRTADQVRAIRAGTSKAMKSGIGCCPACERKQWPIKYDLTGLGHIGYACRYCGHEWTALAPTNPQEHDDENL